MGGIRLPDFERLAVWRKAHELTLLTYELTGRLPEDEKYGLSSQLRRAAVSIPANIVEGEARQSQADFARFISIALGSVAELQYLLLLCRDLGYLTDVDIHQAGSDAAGLTRMLQNLHKELTKDR